MTYALAMSKGPARTLLATLAALTLGLSPAQALAAPSDAAVTLSYIRVNYRLEQTATSRIPAGVSAIDGVLARVRRECPLAALGSPQDPESTQLSNEVIGAMVTSAIHGDLASLREYVRLAAPLRWSRRSLTSAVQGYVAQVRTLASLPQPNVCADIRSWAASGFKTLPASTVAFDQRFMPAWVGLGYLPGGLGGYDTPEARTLVARSVRFEAQLADFEAERVETWGHIMRALELWP
jgi:hypothetical protein